MATLEHMFEFFCLVLFSVLFFLLNIKLLKKIVMKEETFKYELLGSLNIIILYLLLNRIF